MIQQRTRKACGPRTLSRVLAVGLAAAAIAPAAAMARPADEGPVGTSPVVDLRSPDAADAGTNPSSTSLQRPGFPSQGHSTVQSASVTARGGSTDDGGGLDTGVLIALIGGGVLVTGGIGMATRQRYQVVRRTTA